MCDLVDKFGSECFRPTATAEIMGVCTETLRSWREEGDGPEYFIDGAHVYYTEDAIADWMECAEGERFPSVGERLVSGFDMMNDGDPADVTQIEKDELGY